MKQRRIKKLVKGHLTAKDQDGGELIVDKVERELQLRGKSVSNPLSNLDEAQLLAVLLDADDDSVQHNDDFAPFDAREQVDTDGDNIGDNRDIILTKVRLDGIFQDLERATEPLTALAGGPTGTLQDLLDEAEAVRSLIKDQAYDLWDSDHDGAIDVAPPGDPAAALVGLTNLQTFGGTAIVGIKNITVGPERFTLAGLDELVSEINTLEAKFLSIQADIAAMTASTGVDAVTINDIVGLADYTGSGDSELAQNEAAAAGTGSGPQTPLADLITEALEDINNPLDNITPANSGSKAMIQGIIDANP